MLFLKYTGLKVEFIAVFSLFSQSLFTKIKTASGKMLKRDNSNAEKEISGSCFSWQHMRKIYFVAALTSV